MYSGRPGKATRWFTSKELRKLNQPSNGHVAYRGKVAMYILRIFYTYQNNYRILLFEIYSRFRIFH